MASPTACKTKQPPPPEVYFRGLTGPGAVGRVGRLSLSVTAGLEKWSPPEVAKGLRTLGDPREQNSAYGPRHLKWNGPPENRRPVAFFLVLMFWSFAA